jgi:COMM domain containing 6
MTVGVGSLVEFEWKLGVAVSSNNCQNLNSPFVRVTLKVKDINHQINSHTFEMSIQEFKVFSSSLFFMCSFEIF